MTTSTQHAHAQQVSRLRRLRTTPLRDVFRGRLTGRLDVDAALADAGLPARLSTLIRDVTRRTRLSRLERAAVARELIAHFQDGLAAGHDPVYLRGRFGEPHQAARLIRRAKRRNRPLPTRALALAARTAGILFLASLVIYAILAVEFYNREAEISVNYWQELGEPVLAIPHEQRAWPLYRQVYTTLAPTYAWPKIIRRGERPRPDTPAWSELHNTLKARADTLNTLRAAADRPYFGYVLSPLHAQSLHPQHPNADPIPPPPTDAELRASFEANPMFIDALLPPLAVIRDGANALRLDAFVAAESGDAQRAYEDLTAIGGMAQQLSRERLTVAQLVFISLLTLQSNTTATILHEYPNLLSDTQLRNLAHDLAGVQGGGDLQISIAGEKAILYDVIQRAYTTDGQGGGRPAPSYADTIATLYTDSMDDDDRRRSAFLRSLMPAASLIVADRAELSAETDRIFNQFTRRAKTPLWQLSAETTGCQLDKLRQDFTDLIRFAPIAYLVPDLERAFHVKEFATQQRDATLVRIALQLHHRRQGHWPQHLQSLIPQLLPCVPRDRFDGGPIKYTLRDGQPLLYSVGADRDDDGGQPPDPQTIPPDKRAWNGRGIKSPNDWAREWIPLEVLKAGDAEDRVPDGDWILWPPAQ